MVKIISNPAFSVWCLHIARCMTELLFGHILSMVSKIEKLCDVLDPSGLSIEQTCEKASKMSLLWSQNKEQKKFCVLITEQKRDQSKNMLITGDFWKLPKRIFM